MLALMLLLPLVTAGRSVYVSSPFDNFRMECPKRAAAAHLSIRMVESVGAKRQDIVFDMSCEGVDELFPWVNIPVGISEMEREDCYYSAMFDPILDETTDFSCKRREYVAGITRLTDTRLQILCCRLRSRDEFNCQETIFNKPIGLSKSTVITHDNQLINAIRVEEKAYVVRFCDLAPRNIADIYADVKTTTVRHRHITTTPKPYAKFEKVSKPSAELVPLSPRPSMAAPVSALPITAAPTTAPPLPTTLKIALPAVVSPDPTTETPTTPPPPQPIAPDSDFTSGNSVVDADEATVPTAAPTMGPSSTPQAVKPHKAKTVKLRTTTAAPTTPTTSSPLLVAEQIDDITAIEKQNIEEDETAIDIPLTASPTHLEDIIRKIQSASSKSAEKMFKETIANLLKEEKSTDAPVVEKGKPTTPASTTVLPRSTSSEAPTTTQAATTATTRNNARQTTNANYELEDGIEDISVSDLSRLTFQNEDFPKSNEKKFAIPAKMKVSKTNLPLKIGTSSDDFVFLRPINSEGTRRAPIRTHRPHVEIWSSEESDNGGDSWEQTTIETPRTKKMKKLRRKITRAYRVTTMETPMQELEDAASSSVEEAVGTYGGKSFAGETFREDVTTTSSPRRDLPSSRKVVESMTHKVDNAHSVDEETDASPFEDSTLAQISNDIQHNIGGGRNLDFRGNEDIEEVIMKLSASGANIRRSPVRDTNPREQKSDKHAEDSKNKSSKESGPAKLKDGNKTHIPKGFQPIIMPEMAVFEKHHEEDIILEEIIKDSHLESQHDNDDNHNKSDEQTEVTENLVLVNSKSFIGDYITTPTQETSTTAGNAVDSQTATVRPRPSSTTEYDPATFYHTPVPKPLKKEKVLTFCTKDVALRDSRNMVIACGGEVDIWYPTRCPQGADCFLSQDSTYRLCCPVSSG